MAFKLWAHIAQLATDVRTACRSVLLHLSLSALEAYRLLRLLMVLQFISPNQVTISLLGEAWRKVELGLFIFMGWLLLPSIKFIVDCLEPAGLAWLVVGGAAYMMGMPISLALP